MFFIAKLVYFSDIFKKPVFDDKGRKIGLLNDLVFKDGKNVSEITDFVIEINRKKLKFPWEFVASLGPCLYLNKVGEKISCSEVEETDFLVNEMLMDKQLVDINGLKIVRVNDVLLFKSNGSFFISSVVFGLRSLLHRLGLEKPALAINKRLTPKFVPWAFVQPLSLSPAHLGLKLAKAKINEANPADIADLLDELSHSERQILFNVLSDEKAAETLIEAHPKIQKSVIEHLQEQKFNSILKKLSPAEIGNLLNTISNLPKEKIVLLIRQMDQKILKKIEKLVEHPEKSAADLMGKEFFTIDEYNTVGKLKKLVKKAKWQPGPQRVYVVNSENKLSGEITIKQLLSAKPSALVKEAMNSEVFSVKTGDGLKEVIQVFSKQNVYELPVVDAKGLLVGIISMNSVFDEVTPKKWRSIGTGRTG